MPSQFPGEHLVLKGNRLVTIHSAPLIDRLQRSSYTIFGSLALHRPSALPSLPPVVGEAQKVECARWFGIVVIMARKPRGFRLAKPHESALFRMHSQTKTPKALRQHIHDPLSFDFMLNEDHGIVRIPNEKAGPTQARLHFLFKPHIKHMMEIDVRQKRRDYAANNVANGPPRGLQQKGADSPCISHGPHRRLLPLA